MPADPVVSPADTLRWLRLARVPCLEPGCTHKSGDAIKVTQHPAGPGFIAPCPGCRGRGSVPDPEFDAAVADALLAVGERDRRIARLTEALERIAARSPGGPSAAIARAVLADEEDADNG